MKVYRQGDVLIKPSKKIDGEKKKDLVLAEGEVTGHSHRVINGEAALYMQAALAAFCILKFCRKKLSFITRSTNQSCYRWESMKSSFNENLTGSVKKPERWWTNENRISHR